MQTSTAPVPKTIADEHPDSYQGFPRRDVTGVILAGGLGRRMGRQDKGLLMLSGRPLIAHIIEALRPQVHSLIINANRNLDSYDKFGLPVVADLAGGYLGPLAGMASVMQTASTPYVLAVPCDSPLVPPDLCARLHRALNKAGADISVADDGNRIQPVFVLLRRKLLPDLLDYLDKGGRKLETWYGKHHLAQADFSHRPETFCNINTPEELAALQATMRGEIV